MEKYIIPALIGAAAGLFAAYWRTRYAAQAQDLSKRIEELCDSIAKLEELSCGYWDAKEDKSSSHYILGVKTKISLLINYLDEEYKEFSKDKTSDILSEFFDSCTGGKFGSEEVASDSARQRKILITGEKLKIDLMKSRHKLY
ncbi:hypothetical protein FH712_07400 [Marinobacter nauticus]|uniref:hypothetical protein n=1 Tax=Marinobacter nauticus TaxID=2743 RepID=UPI00112F9136|nr:hypothetical protein [Marinobacter nauticus]TPW23753.1 hypothetical protein FH712_07400 [Marinobacter nauticus]